MIDSRSMIFGNHTRLSAPSGPRPLVRWLGSEVVVYNPVSADTHLLNPSVVAVLEDIIAGERTYPVVAARFRDQAAPGMSAAQAEAYLCDALTQLSALDLIDVVEAQAD